MKALGGTSDILAQEVTLWQELEDQARRLFHLYGFREIRTPIIEEADLFRQSLGAQTEVVNKQMYEFTDRGNRHIALRPEGTAPAVRAFIEHGLDTTGGLTRWYYLGPMFRAERPQAGRRRQFHQIGVEVFGSSSPYQDAEVVQLLRHLLIQIGLQGFQLKLNSLGCRADRSAMVDQIRQLFSQKVADLCEDCQDRYQKNPLRILDCKEPGCASQRHPVDVSQSVCADCRAHFQKVLQALEASGLKTNQDFQLDSSLVRGLDYYTKTAFEVIHPGLGAQNALGGGGRYDDLVEALGGRPTPAIGFAVGVERILMALKEKQEPLDSDAGGLDVFIASIGEESLSDGLKLLARLREAGISGMTDVEARPLKRQMEQANKLGCRFVLLLGESERAQGMVTFKEMESGQQEQVPQARCVELLKQRLKKQ